MKELVSGWAETRLRKLQMWPPRMRINEHRRGFRDELRVLWRELREPGPGAARRFVIYCTGRSGSTLLVSLLDGNRSVKCAGELLRPWHVSPHGYLVRHARQSQAQAWGFKLLDYHVTQVQRRDRGGFLRRLHRDGFSIIHLERQHHFAQAVSYCLAMTRDVWHRLGPDPTEIAPVRFDLTELEAQVDRLDRQQATERAALGALPRLHIVYERDLLPAERHLDTVRRVGDFIGVALDTADTEHRKIVPRDLSQIIANYDEVRALAERRGRLSEIEG